MTLTVTQFIRPNGRRREATIDLDDKLQPLVASILATGAFFTAELLDWQTVCFCIDNGREDLAIEIGYNGPGPNGVDATLERLIVNYASKIGAIEC